MAPQKLAQAPSERVLILPVNPDETDMDGGDNDLKAMALGIQAWLDDRDGFKAPVPQRGTRKRREKAARSRKPIDRKGGTR